MKRLYLLRHAKSGWDDASLADFDRPLNDRGLIAAPFMGELMASRDIRPAVVVSSPAKRTMQTAELVRESAGFAPTVTYDERIYDASLSTLLKVIRQLPPEADSALLVGHNPGIESVIGYLTGETEPMPTAALASLELGIGAWAELDQFSGTLEFVLRPKDEMQII